MLQITRLHRIAAVVASTVTRVMRPFPLLPIALVACIECGAFGIILALNQAVPLALLWRRFDAAAWLAILCTVLAHGCFLVAGCALVHRVLPRIGQLVSLLVMLASSGVSFVAALYYAKIGGYPNRAVVLDFISDPAAFAAYSAAGAEPLDYLIFTALLLLCCLPLRSAVRVVAGRSTSFGAVTGIGAVGLALILLAQGAAHLSPVANMQAVIRQHSLPSLRLYGSLFPSAPSNAVSLLTPYLPLPPSRAAPPLAAEHLDHVLLIVLESVRADFTPFHGFQPEVWPYLAGRASEWISFREAYAHGPTTESSFPVLISSQYLAGEDRGGRAAHELWSRLRAANVRTAWIDAGSTEWGQLARRNRLHEVDEFFDAHTASDEERSRYADTSRMASALDDRVAVDRLLQFYRELSPGTRSLAVLHLCSTHYPYNVEPRFQVFQPTIQQRPGQGVRALLRFPPDQLKHAYMNGLRAGDAYVARVVEALRASERLNSTAVFLTADHGEAFGEHGSFFHGANIYQEVIHVPLLVRIPAQYTALQERLAKRTNSVVGLVDLMPTAFSLLELPLPSGAQGTSLLTTKPKPYEFVVYDSISSSVAILHERRKYLYDLLTNTAEEYDVERDPSEHVNLWKGAAPTFERFLQELETRAIVSKRGP